MSKKIRLNFNSEIKEKIIKQKIPIHDGLNYLLCLWYDLDPSYIPIELSRKVLSLNIVTMDYSSNTYKWLIPLFEDTEIGFEWISDWMDLFKKVNPERRGAKTDVLRRMKKFFINNPSIRKQDVFKATEKYLNQLTDPVYCKKSHKFIYEIDGTSMLEDFIEISLNKNIDDKYSNVL